MIAEDDTLAGYVAVHGRPPSFQGSDGRPYSVGVYSDDDPDVDGRYGAALLFIRWSADQQPDGHLESPYLARAADPRSAEVEVGRMMLTEVQARLDALIAERATRAR